MISEREFSIGGKRPLLEFVVFGTSLRSAILEGCGAAGVDCIGSSMALLFMRFPFHEAERLVVHPAQQRLVCSKQLERSQNTPFTFC